MRDRKVLNRQDKPIEGHTGHTPQSEKTEGASGGNASGVSRSRELVLEVFVEAVIVILCLG